MSVRNGMFSIVTVRKIWEGFYNKYLNIMEEKIQWLIVDYNTQLRKLRQEITDNDYNPFVVYRLHGKVNMLIQVISDLERLL